MGRWWQGAVGYEIYPRSFADANDDGIGDLAGITERLPYLEWLGVDAIWIAPFYDSPGYDHGYDVADYKAVNTIHGDLEDFSALVAEAHSRAIKVIVDIVPNHSSSHHVWFQEALKGRDNPYRDYYIWRDPALDGGPPNNWVSHFGGPAWTFDEASGQYWCHLFLPEQPDLNWTNPAVRDEFDGILRFWCDHGADGFRIDVAHGVMKDPQFRDNPQRAAITDPEDPSDVFNAFDHLYDLDQDATIEVYQRWNKVVAPYDAVLIGESNPRTIDRVAGYVREGSLHTVFYLEPAWMVWEPSALLERLEAVDISAETGVSWVIDNHDTSRSPTRFGGGDRGRHRSLAVFSFMAALGGFPFLWEGQELGLVNAEIQAIDLEDPISTRNAHGKGRDGTRSVMPWDDSHANGFCAGATPWLHAPDRMASETVAGQENTENSWLLKHRRLLLLRKTLPDLWETAAVWSDQLDGPAKALRRGDVIAIANFGDSPVAFDLPDGHWNLRFDSRFAATGSAHIGRVEVPAERTYLLSLVS
ncbi:MAG: alpha-amylase [bacterium]|nr:alpha-amylase [bacterium]